MNQQTELSKTIRNDYARVKWYKTKFLNLKSLLRLFLFSRSGDVQLDAFVFQDIKLTLLDVLWLAIAYGKMNKRVDAIESL